MNQPGILVQLPDGRLTCKPSGELQLDVTALFDGPDAFPSTQRIQAQLDVEIAAAGDLDDRCLQAGFLHRATG